MDSGSIIYLKQNPVNRKSADEAKKYVIVA